MKDFFVAIQTAFKADPAPTVAGLLSGGLFYDYAPQGSRVPYGIVYAIAGGNADTFTARVTNLRIQVSVFCQGGSSAACWAASGAMTDFLENTSFMVGSIPTRLVRITEPLPRRGKNRLWAAHMDYRALVQE